MKIRDGHEGNHEQDSGSIYENRFLPESVDMEEVERIRRENPGMSIRGIIRRTYGPFAAAMWHLNQRNHTAHRVTTVVTHEEDGKQYRQRIIDMDKIHDQKALNEAAEAMG